MSLLLACLALLAAAGLGAEVTELATPQPQGPPSTTSFVPECDGPCVAGELLLGYLYGALHDPSLNETHLFADLRHVPSWPDDASKLLDACWFSTADNVTGFSTPARVTRNFDNPVWYTGFRIVCASPELTAALEQGQPLLAGLSLQGKPWAPRIPVTRVIAQEIAPVGACLGTFYGGHERSPSLREWALHMHELDVHHFHAYAGRQRVRFEADDLLAWVRPGKLQPGQDIPGMEWVYLDTFDIDFRWLAGQVLHYQHCMFKHRHAYKYLLFLDHDELPIIRARDLGMPALLEQAFQLYPKAAGVSFHRFAFRAGCTNESLRQAGKGPWHAQFDARERHSETHRHVFGHNLKNAAGEQMGDKLAVRPLLVDDFYHHFLVSAREGYSAEPHTISSLLLFLKHVREYGTSCADLTTEEPPAIVKATDRGKDGWGEPAASSA